MFVTGRLAVALAVGIVPLVLAGLAGYPAYAVLGVWIALCVLLVAVDVALAASPRTVTVSRRVPQRVRIGEQVPVSVAVHNHGTRVLHAVLRDAWQPTAGAPVERQHLRLPPGERGRVAIPLLPRRRGELVSEFVMIRSRGPLGIAGRQARHSVRGAIRVLPAFSSRKHLPSRLARLRELDGNTSIQVRGQGTEFDSLREYVRGDDVRSIDWRATARAGTTMLRTWRPERDRHVVIIVDTGRTAAARVGDGTRVDAALEAALLLAALASRAGDHVHLLMYDRVVRARVTGVDGAALLPALTDAMAPVHARLVDTDWHGAFAAVRTLTTRPSLIVVLTAQDAAESARGFLGAFPNASRATTVLVGSVTDDGIAALARRRDSREDVYLAAAAERTLRDAENVADAIRRAGGEAIAADPEELPPRIADRYLELKAAGRL
ncbi:MULTISPECIES: DUF58 domain-containing protein [unclassified Microbacterium]|uniref:DUF58 domain-containing protein n=1 Tax=unclassified Microbacterium TaxID=2609290 RepID=UPI000CFBB272|nr:MULTISPECIES: DUF58 domain-containing protein [unclassified Microbacterium]PQZ56329.1 DUF58 domain-containing protein [Microbacterium sp. MYb43]PQZ79317.1 DUF58 domain-containing protein [Microbacterium sp. MYb40]PRB19884.1 DUF58 domain-containing protein [Microbacterium sp. MYb54]PRB26874.1 DUF58 domain-containing protein [Microbacterium sp. MYb50]PRB66000.1 DUF58 domain-containing protein [Microbacterium sp. MYb24]